MAARLHLKIGIIGERDRLESSSDAVLVAEPSVGSVARSKGSLYAVVTAASAGGPRLREASRLVLETVRREYYYDESAGIPICLQKALRGANRRLRAGRETQGLPEGALGVVVTVVRGHELYVAMVGDVEAYLVRQARLLTLPEEDRGPGLPASQDPWIDVWRGELLVGDTLIMVGQGVRRTVGTEELKNAVVTLHPQSAVEHLHHLFVASGGEGSDALLAIEATEGAPGRVDRAPVAGRPPELLAAAPMGRSLSLATQAASAAGQMRGGVERVREGLGDAVHRVAERLTGLLPRRGPRYRRVPGSDSGRESQRRAALALLAFLGLVAALGISLWLFRGPQADRRAAQVTSGEQALSEAQSRLSQARGSGDTRDPRALQLYREAWAALDRATAAGVPRPKIAPLRAQAVTGLNALYEVQQTTPETVATLAGISAKPDVRDLVIGPDGAAYLLDRASKSVVRVDVRRRATRVVVRAGDGLGVGEPLQLGVGGPDLLIFDKGGRLWRWRPADSGGRGTLGRIRVGGEASWGSDILDNGTYVRSQEAGLYNLYVIDPSTRQIQRYQPTGDGSGFSSPSGYLANATDVSGFRQILVDGDIYALTADNVLRHESGRADDFRLATPPDTADLRPGHDYRLLAATGPRREGRLYVWDARHQRIIAFGKSDGAYQEQFVGAEGVAAFRDLRGMVVLPGKEGQPPILLWATADRLLSTTLTSAAADAQASPSPSSSPSAPRRARPSASASAGP